MTRHNEAIVEIKQARELDPLSLGANANVGYMLYFARQYGQAIEQLKRCLEMEKNFGFPHIVLAYIYVSMGQYNEAISEYQESVRLQGDSTSIQCYLGYTLAKAGRRKEAEALRTQLETTKEYVAPAELAVLYVGLGDRDQALSALERGYTEHDLQLQFLAIEPHYDALRSEPRFKELIRKVGLPQ